MACEFSAPYSHTSGLKNIIYSPNSHYLAYIHGNTVNIRDNKRSIDDSTPSSMQQDSILHIFSCIDKIDKIEFSNDSEYLLCGIYNRSAVQVFSLADPQWRCRINESIAGIVSVTWGPDSRHILIESDFGIQLAIWSLLENTSYIIHSPKLNCLAFSDCQRYLAVGHRLECKDHIAVYSTNPWNELNKFRTRTNDLVSIQWTPGGTQIIVLDSHLCYRVMVYTPAGEIIAQYEAYQNALGIRSLAFHRPEYITPHSSICPSQLLAIGSYDGQVRLLSTRSWKLAFVLPLVHPSEMVDMLRGDVVMTVEVIEADTTAATMYPYDLNQSQVSDASLFSAKRSKSQAGQLGTSYVTKSLKTLPRLSPSNQQPKNEMLLPKFGVSWIGWSSCGQYMAAREESYPRCLWIWHGLEARLCDLLVQLDNIVCARWQPKAQSDENDGSEYDGPVLAFCCNTPRVYFWTLHGSSWADLPHMTASLETSLPKPPISSKLSSSRTTTFSMLNPPSSNSDDTRGIVELPINSLKWSPDGKRLLLIGKERFCVCDVTFTSSHEIKLQHNNGDIDDHMATMESRE